MLTYPWKCTVLHCNHLGNTWKPLVLMTRHFDYFPSASEGDNQSGRSSAPVVSRCFPGGYNVKLYISRGRLAWWLLAFLCCVYPWLWNRIIVMVALVSFMNVNCINSYSASHDNWCTFWGDGGCAAVTSKFSEIQHFKGWLIDLWVVKIGWFMVGEDEHSNGHMSVIHWCRSLISWEFEITLCLMKPWTEMIIWGSFFVPLIITCWFMIKRCLFWCCFVTVCAFLNCFFGDQGCISLSSLGGFFPV